MPLSRHLLLGWAQLARVGVRVPAPLVGGGYALERDREHVRMGADVNT